MTPERINILQTAIHTAKLKGLHKNKTPTPKSFASELLGLLTKKTKLERKHHTKKIKDSYSRALQKSCTHCPQQMVTQEKMASPLDFNPSCSHYWSADSQDALIGAHFNSLSSQFTGLSVCHPVYNEQTMNLSLRHAIYSAILSTEATATFMFLPSWNGSIITNLYSSLLTAYPHLCYKLGTIPADKIALNSPQIWISKETPLPQASWNLHITAVWNTAARLHLGEHNPTWLQNLACNIPEANWHLDSISSHPICNARHAETALGLKKFEKLRQKCKLPGAPTDLLWVKWPPFPINPNRDSHIEFQTGNPKPTRMVAVISKKVKQLLGQRSTSPARATLTWLNQMVLV